MGSTELNDTVDVNVSYKVVNNSVETTIVCPKCGQAHQRTLQLDNKKLDNCWFCGEDFVVEAKEIVTIETTVKRLRK